MTRYVNQTTAAFGISLFLIACGAWLIVKALWEIGAVVIDKSNEVMR